MKLTADKQGRLTCAELFTPEATFDAARQADGSVRVVELVEKDVPLVSTRKEGGFVLLNSKLDRGDIRAAIRADRDAR